MCVDVGERCRRGDWISAVEIPSWACCARSANVCDSMISYPNYKFIFPIKALGMYAKRFGDEKIL
jgi:cobalamin biosynthesis protein CobD/CbiB